MSPTLWHLPQTYVLLGYSVLVLAGLVVVVLGKDRIPVPAGNVLFTALLVLSLPGSMIMGALLEIHAYVQTFSTFICGSPESTCLGYEEGYALCEQIGSLAMICCLVLTLVAVIVSGLKQSIRRLARARAFAVLFLALLCAAWVARGPSLRNLLAPSFLGDCLYAGKDLPVSTIVGEPPGQIPGRAPVVMVREDALLVDYMKVASLEGWDPGFDITGPLAGEIEHHVEMRNALCQRDEHHCDFPHLLVGASREAPTSLVARVARIACSTWKGPCSLVIRSEPVPDPPRGLEETVEIVTRDGRIRCTTECPYALIAIGAAGTAVLPDDPGLAFRDFIAGLEEGTTSVTLPPAEPSNEQRTMERVERELESLSFPLSEEELRQKLGLPDLEPLSAVDIMDGVVNVLSHSYPLPGDCWLHLDVFRTHLKADWQVSGAKVQCHEGQ
jgi:hypothetical protein